jgi:hypothetical protein
VRTGKEETVNHRELIKAAIDELSQDELDAVDGLLNVIHDIRTHQAERWVIKMFRCLTNYLL